MNTSDKHTSTACTELLENATLDFYVSQCGSDDNNGTKNNPFRTIKRAQSAACRIEADRKNRIRINIEKGLYRECIKLSNKDFGKIGCPTEYRSYNGEAVVTGGVKLCTTDFLPVGNDCKFNFFADVKGKIKCIDLKRYGITGDDIGFMKARGAFNTADKYDAAENIKDSCELYYNGKRMTLARYPNSGNLKIEKVLDIGEVAEYPPQNYFDDWAEKKNPRGGTFTVDESTAERMKRWSNPTEAWMFGYFYWDWADSSTPVKAFDTENRRVTCLYNSMFGFKEDADYYFYNVPEEIDSPGEWYIDRQTLILYFYPPDESNNADIELSVSTNSVIDISGANGIVISGLRIINTRADAVIVNANNCIIENCIIENCSGSGAVINGRNNTVRGCEFRGLGKGGIVLNGGDRELLIPGNNIAQNNLIHNYGEIHQTYFAGISLSGVGNKACHNEIYNAPHMGIFYTGNDHLIEYNLVYDVVRLSSDAGAIYAGRNWTYQGVIIRFNIIKDIGSGDFEPSGIYMDDCVSGAEIYGNILVNIPGYALLLGGGRDMKAVNNIVVDSKIALWFDDRGADGFFFDGWFRRASKDHSTELWTSLEQMPYKSSLWASRYPSLSKISTDASDPYNPDFAINPSYNKICSNVFVGSHEKDEHRAKLIGEFPNEINNICFADKADVEFENQKEYILKPNSPVFVKFPDFKNIPVALIGSEK